VESSKQRQLAPDSARDPFDHLLDPLTGEFLSSADDDAFRLTAWASTRHLLRTAFAVAATINIPFFAIDFTVLGIGRPLALIALARLGTLPALWMLWRLGRTPSTFRQMEYAVLGNIACWGVLFFTLEILNPVSRFYVINFAVATAVLVSVLDISSRITLLSWGVWSFMTLIGAILTFSFSIPTLIGLSLALLMSGLIGRIIARRGNQLSRRHYLLLQESEAARATLESTNRALEDAHRRLKKNQEELALIIATDTLTGAVARREFINRGSAEIRRAKHSGKSIGLLLLDIDYFKSINDGHGHAVGDAALVAFVDAVTSGLHAGDCVGRIGGEEFAVLLPEITSEARTAEVAERLRARVAAIVLAVPKGTLRFTVSVGAAVLLAQDTGIEVVIARADRALYAAKRGGRNRVVLASSDECDTTCLRALVDAENGTLRTTA
jgi:diguanylate cyclase (GGDEF)-like protein